MVSNFEKKLNMNVKIVETQNEHKLITKNAVS